MARSAFWRLIDTVDRGALRDGDEEGAIEPLIDAMAQCDEEDIREFEDILAQCLYDIDGESYADQAGQSRQSGDGFLYSRCYVVAQGRKAAQRAWAAATGNDEETWDYHAPVSYETGSNKANWTS